MTIAAVAATVVGFVGNNLAGTGGALPHTVADAGAITSILNIVLVIVGALAFLFMVIAGFRFVNSRGDPSKIADVRRQLVYSVIGFALIASASAIVNFVIKALGS